MSHQVGDFVVGPGYRAAAETPARARAGRWRLAFVVALVVGLVTSVAIGQVYFRRNGQFELTSAAEGTAAKIPYGTVTLREFKLEDLLTVGKDVKAAPEGTRFAVAVLDVEADGREPGVCRSQMRGRDGEELTMPGVQLGGGPLNSRCGFPPGAVRAGQKVTISVVRVVPQSKTDGIAVLFYPASDSRGYVRLVPKR